MNKNRYGPYSLGIIVLLILSTSTPVFGEVTSLQTDSESFYKGDQIKFSGTTEKDSTGLVTIVIRDQNEEFVMLTQAIINPNDTFEKIVTITDKFSEHGMYNATGFILNMTKGVTNSFGVSLNGVPIIEEKIIEESVIKDQIDEPVIEESVIEETIVEEKIEEEPTTKIANFVDTSKDPQHYIERYYNEVSYKSWFDRNYPGLTIEEAVGYTEKVSESKSPVEELIKKEIIPEAQASSIVQATPQKQNNSETASMILAIVGLGILFGAVYGIKRKVDDNTKHIHINKETIKKIIYPIRGSNPHEILQNRLVKGEISVEEYEKINSKLD